MEKNKQLCLSHKSAITVILTIFLMYSPIGSSAQQTVGLFTKNSGDQEGYVLFSPGSSYITYLIDKCGKLVHKWNSGYFPGLDAYLLPNGNLLTTGRLKNLDFNSSGSAGGLLQIFSWSGKLIWNYAISDDTITQNHDVYPMPNGDILVCEWEKFSAAQAIAAGRDSVKLKGSDVWSMMVQEIKPIGGGSIQVVWQWRLWDHLIQDHDATKPNYGVISQHPELLNLNYTDSMVNQFGSADWTHGNSVTYNPDLDQIMISSRNMNEIYVLDHSTTSTEAASHSGGNHKKGGDFLYRWGNPAAYNRGSEKDKRLYVQHDPAWIPKGYPGAGNITVFNNGDGRPSGNYSSADVIVPPVDSNGDYKLDSGKAYGPDSSFWSYADPKTFYSTTQGGVQRLQNGNTLICEADSGTFIEVDSNKNVVWKYVNPVGAYGPTIQGYNPGINSCFKADLYMENFPGFKNITLKPLDPIEYNAYYYSCYMPYVLYITPLYKISELKGYNSNTGIADSLNAGIGFIKGVVESQDLGNGIIQFAIADSTGAITIIINSSSYKPAIGDSVLVGGIVTQNNGLTEYSADTIIVESKGTWQKKPDIISGMDESHESDLVKIENVWISDTMQWIPSGNGFVVQITNGIQTYNMFINKKTDLYKTKAPLEEFNVTGVEIQNEPTKPYFGFYEIEPRGSYDIERVAQLYKIKDIRVQNPKTGIADSSKSIYNFYIKGIVQSPDFTTNGLNFSVKDSTGSIIISSSTDVSRYTPIIGDSVEIRGLLRQVNGLTEVVPDSISSIKNAYHSQKALLVHGFSEDYEARLIKLNGYYISNPSHWTNAGDGFIVNITNGEDTLIMRIASGTNLFNMNALQGYFDVSGIEIQDQPDSPFFGNYIIEPRGKFDIEKYVPQYTISQVRPQNPITGIADSAGSIHPFYLVGVVQSPDYSSYGLNFSIKDSTGSIIVYSGSRVNGYMPETGDSIILRGLLTQYDGLTEVIPDSVALLNKGPNYLNPQTVSELSENLEAKLIKLDGYYLSNPSQWVKNGSNFNVEITNGTDTFTMNVSSNIDLSRMNAPKEIFNVTGVEIQAQQSPPYFGNYQIKPRGSFDIQRVTQLYKISQLRHQDPITGIADSAGSRYNFFIKAVVQSPDLTSSGLDFSVKDSTGSIMILNDSSLNNYIPKIGDSLLIRGLLIQNNGMTGIKPDSILKFNALNPIKTELISTLNESFEAHLIQLSGYYLSDSSQWSPASIGFSVNITNGTDTFNMYISAATDLYKMHPLKGIFNVNGIEIQDKTSPPYIGNYQIVPRGFFDFERNIQLYKIRQVRVQDPVTGIADSAGSKYSFLLKGIVQSPDFSLIGYDFSIKDSTGSVFVKASSIINNYIPKIGDSVEIRGLLTQLNGLTTVSIDSIAKINSGSHVPPPENITGLSESLEGHLIRFNRAWVINPEQWKPKGSGFNVEVTNSIDTISLYVSNATNTFKSSPPKGKFDVTGIVSQNKNGSPYIGNYFLMPRNFGDFQLINTPYYKIRQVKGYNLLSGIADSINTYCYLKGIVQSSNLSGNQTEFYTLQDSTGSITVSSDTIVTAYNPVVGDSILASGMVLQENGLTKFITDSISKLSHSSQISPLIVESLDENTESELVTLKNYTLVDPVKWDTTGANGSFSLKAFNESDTILLTIVKRTDLYSNAAKPIWNVFDVVGIESQYDSTRPYLSGYYLIPRSISDFSHSSAVTDMNSIEKEIYIYPNPAEEYITVESNANISSIMISDILGKTLYSKIYRHSHKDNINISFLNKGIYFVKVYSGFNYETIKLIKE